MCTTTLEAPELSSAATEPVDITTCASVVISRALLEEQSSALPLKTQDLANGFDSSLALESIGLEQTLQSKLLFVEIDNESLQPLW